MKLITYSVKGEMHLGAIMGDQVVNLAAAARDPGIGPVPDPTSLTALSNMKTCLEHWETSRLLIRDLLDRLQSAPEETAAPFRVPLDQVKIEPPIPNPGKIVGVGLNYADHCREQNLDLPERPILFAKFPSAVVGPGDGIHWPADSSTQVDYEAELAVVIGHETRGAAPENALAAVAGYTIANDVSARDVQFSDGQWIRGKSFDTFCPLGPYLVTADEILDPQQLSIRCKVNGKTFQDSNTSEMVFSVAEIIAFITRTSTLYPGDVICTGTPAGVGVFRDPKIFLKPGDMVEIEIAQLGKLQNRVL